ncbi:hypothetical protein T439DRAFT_323586 [Meredithblackwellia eburnea MCA 4105]
MDKWTALAPDRRATDNALHAKHYKKIRLIGKLPAEAYIQILAHLPVPDFPAFALVSRRFAELTRDDRVWRPKLQQLDYHGPGEIDWRDLQTSNTTLQPSNPRTSLQLPSVNGSATAANHSFNFNSARPQPQPPPPPLYAAPPAIDDDFGDFSGAGDGDVSLVTDDGFGDFQDFNDSATSAFDASPQPHPHNSNQDLFGFDDFGSLSINGGVASNHLPNGTKASAGDDLMMLFDDDDSTSPPPSKQQQSRPPLDSQLTFQTPTPPKASSAFSQPSTSSTLFKSSASVALPPPASPSGLGHRDIFIKHQHLLLPYYLSFISHTTSSLLFTSPTLNPETRARLLSSLVRFCHPLVAPTRSLPQRQTVLRNVQSGMDFFESALLAEFERADNRGEEEAMKEKARILWDLNGSMNVVQVFVQKREIFYDQSHNPLINLTKVETPSGERIDGIDFSPMNSYVNDVIRVVNREGGLIARVFPPEADVLIYFMDRIANDVVSDYITSLLSDAQPLQQPLFLLATAATFGQVYRLVDAVLAIEPKHPIVTKERAEDVIFKMFEPHMDDYLQEEGEWIRVVLEGMCNEWDTKTASDLAVSDPTFLASSNPALVKKNVLAGFTKVLLLPVTIIPKTASMGLNAITYGATGAFNTFASLGTGFSGSAGATPSRSRTPVPPSEATVSTASATAPDGDSAQWTNPRASIDESGNIHIGSESINTSTTSSSRTSLSLASPTLSSNTSAPTTPKPTSVARFDRMQLLLSLDTALQLIQADRDCLKRVQTFVRYPGTYGRKVRDAIEEVFIILLQTLSEKHVCPGFAQATMHMNQYKAEDHEDGTSVAPLVQFFELVHIGDTIQQMVDVYFDKEMAAYIDKKDFLNAVVREKKKFEMALDDAVAQGLNAGVNILMNQVEHIIFTHQGLRDFSPAEGADLDLRATKACREAIEVLSTHCDMLKGSTDKQILEVFHQEVGIRLHGILLKHLKRLIVSIEGGFQLIADLNAYHSFVASLRQPQVTAYFTSLKMVGEIFIIDSPKDLGHLVRDVSRYDGTLSTEDLYEIVQRRADWKRIEKEVERGLFGFKKEDCCVM